MNQSDFVISNGKLVGKFDELYQNFKDPWNQSNPGQIQDSRRQIAISSCRQLRDNFGCSKVIELGCGFGHLSGQLAEIGFQTLGVDVSTHAIHRARELYPEVEFTVSSFDNWDLIEQHECDVFILAEITWYVLNELDAFLRQLKTYAAKREKPTFLIQLLTTYESGVQEYGKEKFTNLTEILEYFALDYLEYGFVKKITQSDPNSQGTYFIAMIK